MWTASPSPAGAAQIRDIAVTATPGSAQSLVVLDADGQLFTQAIPKSGPGSGWAPVAPLPGRVAASAIAATCDNSGRPVLVATGDTLYESRKASDEPAAGWLPWTPVPNAPRTSSFVASALPSGAPLLLATTTSGQVLASHVSRGGWTAWTPLTQFSKPATAATAARCGDLNTAVWAASDTAMHISWTLVPSDTAGWSTATDFAPEQPDTFDLGISNIDIEQVRSGGLLGTGKDTDYAYVAVKVGKKPSVIAPLPDPPLNVGAGH